MPTGTGDSSLATDGPSQVGGVRADFVANLGRRLAEVRRLWDAFAQEPSSLRARDEVQRRVHGLVTRARVVGLSTVAERLDAAEQRLVRAAQAGAVCADDLAFFDSLIAELPAVAWSQVGPAATPPAPASTPRSPPVSSLAVLVIGPPALAASLAPSERSGAARSLDIDHTDNLASALDLARALAPDVVLADGDLPGVVPVLESLVNDPLTAFVPLIIVASRTLPDRFAALARHPSVQVLAKPLSVAQLRRALADSAPADQPPEQAVPRLDGSVADIADLLAAQLRRGLVDALQPASRNVMVQLGDSPEALAAVWGAVARVRELLTSRSQGAVRFSVDGPGGAVPLAPHLEPAPESSVPVRLDGRRVLIADDDPAVTQFFGEMFRSAGATTEEAPDGVQAFDLALRFQPDVVVTDILMPGMDGFALCRLLKRDPALRDVPVVLLSWKEDLLQRMRELGADADAYLRKEAGAASILRGIDELLQLRAHLEQRLRVPGEVRGRLDGLSATTLLRVVSSVRPNARVSVRDATFVYEMLLQDGALAAATRTASNGTTVTGGEALGSFVGLASGRYQILEPDGAALEGDGESLAGHLEERIASVRAAQSILSGAELPGVARVVLRQDALMIDAAPGPTRALFAALAQGTAPHALASKLGVAPSLVDRVLHDASLRGAIVSIRDDRDRELLEDATAEVLRKMRLPKAPRTTGLVAFSTSEPAPVVPKPRGFRQDTPPASLTEAVSRSIATGPSSLPPRLATAPVLVDVRDLHLRTQEPRAAELPSLAPDAVVPARVSTEREDRTSGELRVPGASTMPPAAQSDEPDDAPSPVPARTRWWPAVLLALLLAALLLAVAQYGTSRTMPSVRVVATSAATATSSSPTPPPSATAAASSARAAGPSIETDLTLPDDLEVAPGMGVIEVHPGRKDITVLIDGLEIGEGEVVRSVVRAGSHAVSKEGDSKEHKVTVTVRALRRTRVSLEGAWGR